MTHLASLKSSVYLLILLAMSLPLPVDARSVAPKLHSDPFKEPDLLLTSSKKSQSENAGEKAADWQPRLRATMRFGSGAMVNVDGDIIAIGEEITGFRLLEVQERMAIFVKQGQEYPVSLDDLPQTPESERYR